MFYRIAYVFIVVLIPVCMITAIVVFVAVMCRTGAIGSC